MRPRCSFMITLMLAGAVLAGADEPPRRTTRVAPVPVRSEPPQEPQLATPAAKPAIPPPVARPALARPDLLEPTHELAGLGRGAVACFQVQVEQAEAWQLVVREVDGPVAQVFEGEGAPPTRIAWDGRLLDGGLAWCGLAYTYDIAYEDSSGTVDRMTGTAFTLPAYSREEAAGVSFLVPGSQLAPGRHGDAPAAARAGLQRIAESLNRTGGQSTVHVEVLARDEAAAMNLAATIRTVLETLLESSDRSVEAYAGAAAAAPAAGTVLITTLPWPP